MKGSECRLIKYMDSRNTRFIIPVYQRNYDWKTENCKQLYNDLIKIVENGMKSHFFGSIVSVYKPSGGGNTEYLIIDGQQRLTTISLLFLAMYNLISKGVLVPNDASLDRRIYEDFLVDKYQPQEKRMKLKPVKNDQKAFGKLFEEEDEEHIRESNVTANYNYFYDRLQQEEISLDEMFDAICRLEIINIELSDDDNPQLIFESLNSTGLDLSEGDKIRNFILMSLPADTQNEYYEKYWNRIEECTKYDVSPFVRDYLSVKRRAIPPEKKVYTEFKEYVESNRLETEPLLADMLNYAKRYAVLLNGRSGSHKLDACIDRLNRLSTTVTRPFFLEVLRLRDEGRLDIPQVTDIFTMTENYIVRRSICNLPTNALNKIFLMLHHEIVRYDGTEVNYAEKFKYALFSKKEGVRFPGDEEFSADFAERSIYLMSSKNRAYIMERLENFGTAEDKDIYGHFDGKYEKPYSIEHIMPQNLTREWARELGEDCEHIHSEWLHRIANLTLTAYNSKYSDRPFLEKRDMENGFRHSGLRMNQRISEKDRWTEAELEERSRHLAALSLEIWPSPMTDYVPPKKQLDSYTLDDDPDLLTNRTIVSFTYKNSEHTSEHSADSWADMYQTVLLMLYNEDKSILTKLAASSDKDILSGAFSFGDSEASWKKIVEIGGGIYTNKTTSTQLKLKILNQLFQLYGIDPSNLVFYLRDENTSSDEDAIARYELRRRYWTYALPIIQDAHRGADGRGSFCGVNPVKDNYIKGFLGIGGFCLSCVLNTDSARVELVLENRIRERNKRTFDELLSHRAEIEAAIDAPLEWQRNDDNISSKVACHLNGASISDESCWHKTAEFHAAMSKKFFDVFLPYLAGGQNLLIEEISD